jgi:hypothetical protein
MLNGFFNLSFFDLKMADICRSKLGVSQEDSKRALLIRATLLAYSLIVTVPILKQSYSLKFKEQDNLNTVSVVINCFHPKTGVEKALNFPHLPLL